MNTSTAENPVQWLFLDLNAFFASCEQQENPALRGQPVIVVQTPTDSAVAIHRTRPIARPWCQEGLSSDGGRRIELGEYGF